ncbi:hypothetical protein [Saccharibacillus sacchari]|uniref:hypothetical protein n=1 Tax=Saccharibacillus sacchari TaxID=456493 RepID=UPI0004B05BDA|nr:hypothetical protein [Saccharibacillus sacchari]
MEKVSFNKGDSGNWAIDYKPSAIVNPDIVNPTSKLETSKVVVMKDKTELNTEKTGEKELLSDEERKKREVQLAQKLADERLAQQKLMQTFYAEKARVELSPEKLQDAMKALAQRSIEQLMIRDGSSMKMEWKSELHQVRVEISVEAYDKLNEHSSSRQDFAEAVQA